ncbi:hypothetical protein [Chryseolinea sp. H1M3-3]|uniref:hypothetical protein n=1 Tax=Chryseolinea sp. H1M3-3 TaxID=3034144 RepID=UPI0023EAB5B1|nr:hypothetical protein [Chryseolinea sp. H1M3-3]
MRIKFIVFIVGILLSNSLHAQLVEEMEDESRLYAENKQVNQFFRRFNGEEDEKGERYYPKDRQYRSEKLRKKYIGMLFDASNPGISPELKVEFAKEVLNKDKPVILNFHGANWFSEVHTLFTMNGKDVPVTLFMELEKHHLGTRWVISRVYSEVFKSVFEKDTVKVGKFLHPLSHELDFMNLRKAFSNADSVNQYTLKKFIPDHLSVFLYEIRKGNMKFKTVEEVKFHFFQINGWYFELAEFNRSGYNTGWLISNLVKVKNESEKNLLRKYVYYETK